MYGSMNPFGASMGYGGFMDPHFGGDFFLRQRMEEQLLMEEEMERRRFGDRSYLGDDRALLDKYLGRSEPLLMIEDARDREAMESRAFSDPRNVKPFSWFNRLEGDRVLRDDLTRPRGLMPEDYVSRGPVDDDLDARVARLREQLDRDKSRGGPLSAGSAGSGGGGRDGGEGGDGAWA
jgi:uncharacterized membrane protein YgcG